MQVTLRAKHTTETHPHEEQRRADHASRITESSKTRARTHPRLVYIGDVLR
jgi:hypothetical protein